MSPFTYLVSAVLSTGLIRTAVQGPDIELLKVPPAADETCSSYIDPYVKATGGHLYYRLDHRMPSVLPVVQINFWPD